MGWLRQLFQTERSPRRGLLWAEWAMVAYMVLSLLYMAAAWPRLPGAGAMLHGRLQVAAATAALWLVYRLVPCPLTLLCRVLLQLALLSWWYPDTYALNRILPNLDHHFAALDQQLFGCQPALLFARHVAHPLFSELMYMSYSSYFFLVVAVTLGYFLRRRDEFLRASFVILGAFFAFYVVFVALPVTGPQYYYLAAGADNIAAGRFPDVGHYFLTHDAMMPMPGYGDGPFYRFIAHAHAAGERPTAAFPSSHVGVTVVLLLLALRARSRALTALVAPMLALMCLSTVYIRAHYAVDVIGGLAAGVLFYVVLQWLYSKISASKNRKRTRKGK